MIELYFIYIYLYMLKLYNYNLDHFPTAYSVSDQLDSADRGFIFAWTKPNWERKVCLSLAQHTLQCWVTK